MMINKRVGSFAARLLLVLSLFAFSSGCEDETGPTPVTEPAAPANLQATALTYATVGLAWEDQSTNEVGFRIMRGVTADNVVEVATVGAGVMAYLDSGLDDTTAYYYRVHSYNEKGNSASYASAAATTFLKQTYALIERFMGTGVALLGADGLPPLETDLYLPIDVTWGPDGKAYVVDWNNHVIRVYDGSVCRYLTGVGGETGEALAGLADTVKFNHPTHVSFDPLGNIIITAWHNSKIMKMDPGSRWIEPICGTGARCWDSDDERPAGPALLNLPVASVFDQTGRMFILDMANQRIRVVDEFGNINTVLGSSATRQCATCSCSVFLPSYFGDEGPAVDARIAMPVGQQGDPSGRIEIDSNDNLYIADALNNRVRMIDGAGIIHTIAGTGVPEFSGDDGQATDAALFYPSDVAIDSQGNIFIADTRNHCVRKVDTNGVITTIAGKGGEQGNTDGGGDPKQARFYRPFGVALDADENLYIADTRNSLIYVVYK